MSLIYFDNAATSWPKPQSVQDAMAKYFAESGGNPGRSGHRMSIAAAQVVEDARDQLAVLFKVADPGRIVFAKNATEALNLGINGILRPGDHAITSSIEHNSVMRPLRHLEALGVEVSVVECSSDGLLDPDAVAAAFRPETKLLVTLHGSNVVGSVLPIGRLAEIARAREVPYLVDASQTAGAVPLDVAALGIDMLAFPGHKALLGPTGTGGLYIAEQVELAPLMRGGTGSRSDMEFQPAFMPDIYESGTQNVLGLAGLAAGVRYVRQVGVAKIQSHESGLVERFLSGALAIDGVVVHGPENIDDRCGVLSFNIAELPPSDVATMLEGDYQILSRVGLHCAPGAHRTIGTFPMGSVRFGFGPDNTAAEIDVALGAIDDIASWAGARPDAQQAPSG